MKVFVHLAHGYGAANWRRRHASGAIIGINEVPAYGYARAAGPDCTIVYSEDAPESPPAKLFRLGVRAIFGFDFVHAARNRRGILASDVVWTHTESQYLAVLLLLAVLRIRGTARPKVLAQTVWLMDRWDHLSRLRRRAYARLMAGADVLTFHSPLNLAKARVLFPGKRCDLVRFGIRSDEMAGREQRAGGPIRILAMGNDRDRDWTSLIAATGGWEPCEVRIVSRAVPAEALRQAPNLSIRRPTSNAELFALFDWADLLVVTLKPNLHASGITVMQEAVTRSLPVIVSDVGGLDAYFAGDEVCRLADNGVATIRDAITALHADPARRAAMAAKAQARMKAGLDSVGFAQRHVAISRALLGRGAMPADT